MNWVCYFLGHTWLHKYKVKRCLRCGIKVKAIMKTFIITYEHITGPMGIKCDNLRELSQELERIQDDDYIVESTVSISTNETKK